MSMVDGPVVDVAQVELDGLQPAEVGTAADLPQPGQAGTDVQPTLDLVLVRLDLLEQRRAGADEGHVTAQDVQQLGQLVERVAT